MSVSERLRWHKQRLRWGRVRPGRSLDGVYVGDGVVLTRLASRRLMYVLGRDRSLTPSLVAGGSWAPRVSRLLARLIEPRMNFLDVGANFGYFSLLAADLVGPRGHVIAVEANSALTDVLAGSLQINGFWERSTVHTKAVDERAGTLELRVFPKLLGSSSLMASDEGAAQWHSTLEPITVEAATIDEIVDGRRLDVMKIDVEGAELRAFRGAHRTLQANPQLKIVMEFFPAMLGGDDGARELLEILNSHGLTPHIIRSRSPRSISVSDALALSPNEPTDLYFKAA